MSQDPILYKAPSAYPVPPKDLWYEMPKASSFEKPLQPIFPWESKAPKPTRVFAEDLAPITAPVASSTQGSDDDTQLEEDSPTTPTARVLSPEPWQNYTATNAWDEIPEIENFISSITQHRRGQVQILHDDSTGEDTISLGGRRPSSKLTDFPTEIERPSLPVTPAPVRRPSFWGSERDEEGELPAAEGVPSQADWVGSMSRFLRNCASVEYLTMLFLLGSVRETGRALPTTVRCSPKVFRGWGEGGCGCGKRTSSARTAANRLPNSRDDTSADGNF